MENEILLTIERRRGIVYLNNIDMSKFKKKEIARILEATKLDIIRLCKLGESHE